MGSSVSVSGGGSTSVGVKTPVTNISDGDKGDITVSGGGTVLTVNDNFSKSVTAAADPTVTDDSNSGYRINSRWINTTSDTEFVCTDASIGAAVWKNLLDSNVDSVFGRTGPVTAQAGDYTAAQITETTSAKIMTDTERTKLSGVETSADVTDETNVKAALDGATITATTAVSADKLLLQDASDGDNLRHETVGDVLQLKKDVFVIACSDETTALTAGTSKATFRMPFAFTVTAVRATVTTAPTGAVLTVDINEDGVSILSTKLTIDATEKTSETAATPAVISDSALADDAEITIDIDTVGSTVAGAGLKVEIIGYQTA